MLGNLLAVVLNLLAVVLLFVLAPEGYLIGFLIILNVLSLIVNLSQIIFKRVLNYESS